MYTLYVITLVTIILGPAVLALFLFIRRKLNYRKAMRDWDRLQRRIDHHYPEGKRHEHSR